jgi:hypothetical protein
LFQVWVKERRRSTDDCLMLIENGYGGVGDPFRCRRS